MASRGSVDDDFFGTPLSAAMNMPFNLEVGDIVLGRVSQIDEEFVYVSTGFKSEGRIPRLEFVKSIDEPLNFKVDDEVEVMVDRITGEEIFLSYSKVVEQRRWDELVKRNEDQEPIMARVIKMVKGGFRLDVGLSRHAFLPASHWGEAMPATAEEVEGREVRVLVIELERETGNIVVSQRDLVKKEMSEKEDELFGALHQGDIIEGKVTRLTNFGAFVDVGGAEGLVHISEIAWTRTAHPSQILACGDVVKVKVLDTDNDKKKISLSIKQAQEDPWDSIETRFSADQVLDGTVTRIAKYGMFVKISDEFEGLLHNSEVPTGENHKAPEVNEVISVRIINIDKPGRRIKLGLAAASEQSLPSEMDRYIDHGATGMKIGDVVKGALDEGADKK